MGCLEGVKRFLLRKVCGVVLVNEPGAPGTMPQVMDMVAKKSTLRNKGMTMEEKRDWRRTLRFSVHKDTVLEDAWNSQQHKDYIDMFRQDTTRLDLVMVSVPFWATDTNIPTRACRLVRTIGRLDGTNEGMDATVTRAFFLEDVEVLLYKLFI